MIFLNADLESWAHKDFKYINIFFIPFTLSETSQEITVLYKGDYNVKNGYCSGRGENLTSLHLETTNYVEWVQVNQSQYIFCDLIT